MAKETAITAAYLRSRLDYNPETGDFTWRYWVSDNVHHNKWNARFAGKPAGTISVFGYIHLSVANVKYYAHRVGWMMAHGDWPLGIIDHIDGNKANNRLSNLRIATPHQNAWNAPMRKQRNTSGHKGVCWDKSRNKWIVTIMVHGKLKNLGRFDSKEEAAAAYEAGALRLHGEFARTK